MCTKVHIPFLPSNPFGHFYFMTVYNALLIDITPLYYGSFLCTFCIERDKFQLPVPANMATELNTGEYYDVDFDIYCNQFGNKFSFNFINPAKDNSHE